MTTATLQGQTATFIIATAVLQVPTTTFIMITAALQIQTAAFIITTAVLRITTVSLIEASVQTYTPQLAQIFICALVVRARNIESRI